MRAPRARKATATPSPTNANDAFAAADDARAVAKRTRLSAKSAPSTTKNAFRKGRAAEEAACDYLRMSGFTILWRNLRIGALEIDIVAKKDDLAAIVEV